MKDCDTIQKVAVISQWEEGRPIHYDLKKYFKEIAEDTKWDYSYIEENKINIQDLKNYRLVLLVRCRTLGALNGVKYCLENKIKTIYLLDENWWCAAQSYPQLQVKIGTKSISYFFFKFIVATVDTIFVTSERIAEDVKKYNSRVRKIPQSITIKQFEKGPEVIEKDAIQLGIFVNKLDALYFEPLWRAAQRIRQQFSNVKVYIRQIAETLDYSEYIKWLREYQWDIMVSAVADNRYRNSQCPYFYLESGVLGVVGIYSDTPLYQEIIKNGKNGLLVSNNEEKWYEAITQLIQDKNLRKKIGKQTQEEVSKKYDSQIVLPQFLQLLEEQIENKSLERDEGAEKEVHLERYPTNQKKNWLVVAKNIYSPTVVLGLSNSFRTLEKEGILNFKVITENQYHEYLEWAECIIFSRTIEGNKIPLLEVAKALGKKTLYYADDSLYEIPSFVNSSNNYTSEKALKVLNHFLQKTDLFIGCSEWLISSYKEKYQCQAIALTPTITKPLIPSPIKGNHKITIGFAGNNDYKFFLEKIKDVLIRLYEKYGQHIQFEFFGAKVSYLEQIEAVYFPMIEYGYYEMVLGRRNWDIGIAYLEESEFTNKKYYNKYLEYSRFGIGGVYSDIALFRRIIKHEHNGLLVKNAPEEWYQQLERLIQDEKLRKNISECAQKHVFETFTPDHGAREIQEKLKDFL